MNQHITKLVRQALNECVSTPVESVIASRIDDHGIVEIPNSFAEKFAELIVRECANVCRDQSNTYALKTDRDNCAIAIEQHFGVEE
jgi:hypothetical protein